MPFTKRQCLHTTVHGKVAVFILQCIKNECICTKTEHVKFAGSGAHGLTKCVAWNADISFGCPRFCACWRQGESRASIHSTPRHAFQPSHRKSPSTWKLHNEVFMFMAIYIVTGPAVALTYAYACIYTHMSRFTHAAISTSHTYTHVKWSAHTDAYIHMCACLLARAHTAFSTNLSVHEHIFTYTRIRICMKSIRIQTSTHDTHIHPKHTHKATLDLPRHWRSCPSGQATRWSIRCRGRLPAQCKAPQTAG
jgi:hypothetical protein